jgi:small multidrug resistance pump
MAVPPVSGGLRTADCMGVRGMSHWVYLGIAILSEVVGTTALKFADGFTRPGPTAIVVAGYGIAFYCLSLTLRTMPVGIAYAVWSGVGMALIALIGWGFLKQPLDAPAVAGIALITGGAVLLGFVSKAVPH